MVVIRRTIPKGGVVTRETMAGGFALEDVNTGRPIEDGPAVFGLELDAKLRDPGGTRGRARDIVRSH